MKFFIYVVRDAVGEVREIFETWAEADAFVRESGEGLRLEFHELPGLWEEED